MRHIFFTFIIAFVFIATPRCIPPGHAQTMAPVIEQPVIEQPVIEQPVIEQLDPPGWWIGHSLNPVQVLIRGSRFSQAVLKVKAPGVQVSRSTISPAGDYLIADLAIDPVIATPGNMTLLIESPQGSATAGFVLEALPAPAGKYQGFTPDDVIYLIMPDRFADGDPTNNDPPQSAGNYNRSNPSAYHGGDLQGVIDHLSYLKELGVTAIWLTPVVDNADRATDYHGYGAVDFYRVDEHFGDLAKFRELVTKAHALGLKVIQDQVINHCGPDHHWATSPPTTTFLNGTRQQHLNNPFDVASLVIQNSNPSAVNATLRGWFVNLLPDINQEDPAAASYFIQNSLWWIGQTGLDGIRADTFPYVPRSFWSKWNAALKAQHPQLRVVGEVFDGRPDVVAFFQGGVKQFDGIDSGLETVFDFPSAFAIRDFFVRNQNSVSGIVNNDVVYPRPAELVPFFGNHDLSRLASEAGASPAKQILAFTYLLTLRGTPQLYYGDEIGLQGGNDPDNRRDFPGGFPGDPRNAFTEGGRLPAERQIHDAVRQLLAIRRSQPAVRNGEMTFLRDSAGLLTYLKKSGSDAVLVVINNTVAETQWSVNLPGGIYPEGAQLTDLLFHGTDATATQNQVTISLAARTAALYHAISKTGSVTSLSAASYHVGPLAPGAIVAAFGQELSTSTAPAMNLPLPDSLNGTTVRVHDSAGVERLAPLFYVSPAQVNYLLPPDTSTGPATITITSNNGKVTQGVASITSVAPGLFTANATGNGAPAANLLRLKNDGTQLDESAAVFDPVQNKFVPAMIDLGPVTDQVFLILYGTGLSHRSSLSAVRAMIGGLDLPVEYAGSQGELTGLDQINLRLPRSLIGRGEIDVVLTVDGVTTNTVNISLR